jgi:hypothetical protein
MVQAQTQTPTQTTIDKTPKTNVLPYLDSQIDKIARDLPANYARNLRALDNQKNIATIVNYVNAIEIETNVSEHYRRENIDVQGAFKALQQRGLKITHYEEHIPK